MPSNRTGQADGRLARAMWELEGKAVAAATQARGESVVMLDAAEIARWRKATEPVYAQFKDIIGADHEAVIVRLALWRCCRLRRRCGN